MSVPSSSAQSPVKQDHNQEGVNQEQNQEHVLTPLEFWKLVHALDKIHHDADNFLFAKATDFNLKVEYFDILSQGENITQKMEHSYGMLAKQRDTLARELNRLGPEREQFQRHGPAWGRRRVCRGGTRRGARFAKVGERGCAHSVEHKERG